jgi:hypothetical protein
MIEIHQMTVEDYLLLMELNADIYPEFAKLTDEQKRLIANVTIATGTAQSFFGEGRLVGVGGIRYKGIGEAWMITPPQVRENMSLSLLRQTRETFIKNRDDHNLWYIFATSKISETFLKHLGFEKLPDAFFWMRK